MIEDYLNILDSLVTIAGILDGQIDKKIEEISTDFIDGSIPFADTNLLVEDNTNLLWDAVLKTIKVGGLTASRLTATNAAKKLVSVDNLASWIAGTSDQVSVTDDLDGSVTLSLPQNINTDADVEFDSATLGDLTALELVFANSAKKLISIADGAANAVLSTDGAGAYSFKALTLPEAPINFTLYDSEPARSSEDNWNGAFLSLATAQPLDSVPTDIVVTKGIGKVLVVVNAGSDLVGEITITGDTIDRETGAKTVGDTDTLTIDALTTDNSTTDSNTNAVHKFVGAYVSSKWFTGTVTLSTVDLTLTDVDVFHISYEQFNDQPGITIRTLDANLITTNVNAEFDCYLFTIHVTGDKCDIHNEAGFHVGADGETALANKYWRLRQGNIDDPIDGTTDGFWIEIHYSNTPAYVEDVTIKLWATQAQSITLT
jgi:hypothetical protein